VSYVGARSIALKQKTAVQEFKVQSSKSDSLRLHKAEPCSNRSRRFESKARKKVDEIGG
jgi:hypothetical protein